MFVSSIVLGELYYGPRKSSRTAANAARVDEFARTSSVLLCDSGTAVHYGHIKDVLRAKERPSPENDVWIAAIARQHSLSLATRDGHLNQVEDISVLAW